jgi:hypothetical protein
MRYSSPKMSATAAPIGPSNVTGGRLAAKPQTRRIDEVDPLGACRVYPTRDDGRLARSANATDRRSRSSRLHGRPPRASTATATVAIRFD